MPGASAVAVSQELKVAGFDRDGEPIIQVMHDGSIRIVFEAMPPNFAEDRGSESDFDEFEKVISEKMGLAVVREDREVFVIRNAPPGTAERIKAWLDSYHNGSG
jgi:hypothetical protein